MRQMRVHSLMRSPVTLRKVIIALIYYNRISSQINKTEYMKILVVILLMIHLQGLRLSSKQVDLVKKSGLLKVKGLSDSEGYENSQKCCFTIETQHKNKRKGYDKLKKKYNTIKNTLINRQIINDGTSFQLLKQVIRMNNNQKIWCCKRVVCVVINEGDEQGLGKVLKKHKINKNSFGFSTDITQQDLLMRAFHDAKTKAKAMLDRINYKIIKIQSISVLNDNIGIQYPVTDYSSLQDDEVSSLSEQAKRSASTQQSKDIKDSTPIQDVQVQIVFIVKQIDDPEDEESSSEQQAQSEVHNRSQRSGEVDDSSQQL